MTKSKVT